MRKIALLIFLIPHLGYSLGTSYSFIIKITPHRILVDSPNKVEKNTSVIITNDSLTDLYGKIVDSRGALVEFVAIPKKEFENVTIKGFKKKQSYYFIPLSPPYQELELKVGNDSYEIPPEI